MYKCVECESVFEEPLKESEDCTPGGAFEGGSFIRYYTVCPNCQSEGYLEAKECDCCGEYFFEEELTDTEGMVNGGVGYVCPGCLENGGYYYNCDMSIMTNKKLNSYEREKIAENIRHVVSDYDKDIKKLRAIEDMYSNGVVDLEKLHNLVVNNEYPTDKE